MASDHSPASFREYAGVLAAFIVVMAFVAIGFLQMAANVLLEKVVSIPESWMAAMLSLASAAIGFLIGKQSSGTVLAPPTVNASPDATITVSPGGPAMPEPQ